MALRIDAGNYRAPRRHAHGRLAVHAVEAGGAARDLIDIRREDLLATIAARGLALVLVRTQEEQIELGGLRTQDEGAGGCSGEKLAPVHDQLFNVDSQSPHGLRVWPTGVTTSR